jgi:hypothetical protein
MRPLNIASLRQSLARSVVQRHVALAAEAELPQTPRWGAGLQSFSVLLCYTSVIVFLFITL